MRMVITKSTAVLAALLSVACVSNPETLAVTCYSHTVGLRAQVAVSPAFGDVTEDVLDSVEEWSRATHGRVSLRAVIADANEGVTVAPGAPTCTGRSGVEILVSPEAVRSAELRGVVLHEIGHALGLEHSEGGLMHPRVRANCIDAHTVRAFCDLHGCPDGYESTCK
jgi:hypothetical protein